MKTRVITAICILAVVVPCLFLGGIAFELLAAAFVGCAAYEITQCCCKNAPKAFVYSLYPILLAVCFSSLAGIEVLFLAIAFLLIYLFAWLVFCPDVTLESIGAVYLLFVVLAMTVAGIRTCYEINKLLIFFMIIATVLTDTFALFTGMAFGRHKLNERISPKKTIEGAIGGYLVAAVVSVLFGLLCLKNISPAFVWVAGLTMPLVGQIGDLAFSAIKRHYGIKDFGKIFPGHGGVLDRLDSISFNMVWMFGLMIVML